MNMIGVVLSILCLALAETVTGCMSGNKFEDSKILQHICEESGEGQGGLTFMNPSQVHQLVSKEQETLCDTEYVPAIKELHELLAPEQLQNICSVETYKLIRTYHEKYIHFYLPEKGRKQLLQERHLYRRTGLAPIPTPQRDFFIMFVKQINAACKRHLVKHLRAMKKLHRGVRPSDIDFYLLKIFWAQVSQVSHKLSFQSELGMSSLGTKRKPKFNELQIIDPMDAQASKSFSKETAKLHVQVEPNNILSEIKRACDRRFVPIYSELFAPVIRLNNLGYIERTWSQHEDEELNGDEFILRWHRIIQICEALKGIAVYPFVMSSNYTGKPKRRVEILSPNEAHKLRENVEYDSAKPAYDPVLLHPSHEPVALTSHIWPCDASGIKRELRKFQDDLNQFVWERTSRLHQFKKALEYMGRRLITFQARSTFTSNKDVLKALHALKDEPLPTTGCLLFLAFVVSFLSLALPLLG